MIQKTERARNPETTLHMTDKRLRARVLSQLEHQQDMHTRHNDVDPQGSILFVVVHHYEHQERTTKREREREREKDTLWNGYFGSLQDSCAKTVVM